MPGLALAAPPAAAPGAQRALLLGVFLQPPPVPAAKDPVAMVKEQVAHPQDPHHPSEKPVIHCHKCGEPCKGEVLRVQTKHFHIKCFTCKVCGCDLAQGASS